MTDYYDAAFQLGRSYGLEEGYAAGWDAAEDVTVSRILLDHRVLADLSPRGRQYDELRAVQDAGPCDDPACRACRIRLEWLERNGGDFPGVLAALRAAS